MCECFEKAETAWSDLDEESSAEEDFQFLGGDEDRPPSAQRAPNQESAEFERFFAQDMRGITQFVISYGGKLLYKNNLNIDSTSLFMLLLESAHFLDYKCGAKTESDLDEFDEDAFESASGSISPESAIEELEQSANTLNNATTTSTNTTNATANNNNTSIENSMNESLINNESTSLPKPSYSETYAESFQSVMSTPLRFGENFDFKFDDSESKV